MNLAPEIINSAYRGNDIMVIFPDHNQRLIYCGEWFGIRAEQLKIQDSTVVFRSAKSKSSLISFRYDHLILVNTHMFAEDTKETIEFCRHRSKVVGKGLISEYSVG